MKKPSMQPRILRIGQAPAYLGMCREEFNKTVRPHVREFPIGKQGVGFDRHDLDEWADGYIATNAVDKNMIEVPRNSGRQVSPSNRQSAGSQKPARPPVDPHAKEKLEFERVLEMVRGNKKKQNQPRPKK